MTNLPDLEAWAIFARVAELGSFSRAAVALDLSKATVSKALARLEARLGAPLLHRSSRRLALTDSGRAALGRAQAILAEGAAVEAEMTERVDLPRGLVRVTAPLSFGLQTLGTILPRFLALYPAVSLDLCLTDRRVDLVGEGIDLALRIGELRDSALRARQLHEVRRLTVASPGHLARHGTPHHPRDLEHRQAVLFNQIPSPGTWTFHHATEGECSIRVTGRYILDNGDIAVPALVAGIGIAVMPEFLVWQAIRSGDLVELLPGWTIPPTALHLVTPATTLRPARVTALIDLLTEHFRRVPWAGTPTLPKAVPHPQVP